MELRWKRKGGRRVAEAAGTSFRVEDDGAYAYRLPSGAWQHGRAANAEVARAECERIADDISSAAEADAADLAARRDVAAKLAAMDPKERSWTSSAATLLVMVSHDGIRAEDILARMQPGALRDFFAGMTGDAEFMAALRAQPRDRALRRLEDSMRASLGELRAEEG
jgi:hypothetical protein